MPNRSGTRRHSFPALQYQKLFTLIRGKCDVRMAARPPTPPPRPHRIQTAPCRRWRHAAPDAHLACCPRQPENVRPCHHQDLPAFPRRRFLIISSPVDAATSGCTYLQSRAGERVDQIRPAMAQRPPSLCPACAHDADVGRQCGGEPFRRRADIRHGCSPRAAGHSRSGYSSCYTRHDLKRSAPAIASVVAGKSRSWAPSVSRPSMPCSTSPAISPTAVNIAITQGLFPVFVLLGSFVAFGSRPTPMQVVGAMVTLVGIAVLASRGKWRRLYKPHGQSWRRPHDRRLRVLHRVHACPAKAAANSAAGLLHGNGGGGFCHIGSASRRGDPGRGVDGLRPPGSPRSCS